jgi:hypothetical protein
VELLKGVFNMSITFKKTRERFKKLRDDRNQKNKIASDKAKTTAKTTAKTATTTKKKSGLSDFEKAFATARRNFIGKKTDPKTGKPAKATFMFKGKRYNVQTKEDRAKVVSKIPSPAKRGSGTSKTTKAATSTTKPTTTKKAVTSTTKPTTKKVNTKLGQRPIPKVIATDLDDPRLQKFTRKAVQSNLKKSAEIDRKAKQVEKDKLRRAKRFMDPLMALTGVKTRILGIQPKGLKTMVLDRLGSTKKLSGPPKALPRPRGMAKGGSYFKGEF